MCLLRNCLDTADKETPRLGSFFNQRGTPNTADYKTRFDECLAM